LGQYGKEMKESAGTVNAASIRMEGIIKAVVTLRHSYIQEE